MSTLNVNTITPNSGTTITIGGSGDTITLPSGATLAVASGATISNSGTASGFGGGKVLQMKYSPAYSTTTTISGVPSEISTNYRVSITPVSATSNILVMFYVSAYTNNMMGGMMPYVSTDGGSSFAIVNGSATSWGEMVRNASSSYFSWMHNQHVLDTNVSSGERIYTMYGAGIVTTMFTLNNGGGDSVLMAMEIET